ncbi:hypothetical protein [Paenibacillus taichungensis]
MPKQRSRSSAYDPEQVAHADPDHIPGSRTAGGADGKAAAAVRRK